MPYIRLQMLRKQFEKLSAALGACRNRDERRELLKRMKTVINETDKLISKEVLHLDSTNQNAP